MTVLVVLVFAFLILCIIAAFKESKLTGIYKTLEIFGRAKAYLALDFTLCGLGLTGFSIVTLFGADWSAEGASLLILPLVGIAIGAIGVLLYISALKKAPKALRKRVIIDMILVGLGVSMKMTLFFFSAVWEIVKPEVYVDAQGNSYYVYIDGNVYDSANGCYGTLETDSNGNTYVKHT